MVMRLKKSKIGYYSLVLLMVQFILFISSCDGLEEQGNLDKGVGGYDLGMNVSLKESSELKKELRGELLYECMYKPHSLIAKREGLEVGTDAYERRLESLSGAEYYDFTIRKMSNRVGDLISYRMRDGESKESRVKYFSFDMQHDFKIVRNGEVSPCVLFHFEQMPSTVSYLRFLLAFERIEKSEHSETEIWYEDKPFTGEYIIFKYSIEDYENSNKN